MSAHSAAVLNIAPDHVDWHGSLTRTRRQGRITRLPGRVRVQRRGPGDRALVMERGRDEGCRAIGSPSVRRDCRCPAGRRSAGDRRVVEQRATRRWRCGLSDVTRGARTTWRRAGCGRPGPGVRVPATAVRRAARVPGGQAPDRACRGGCRSTMSTTRRRRTRMRHGLVARVRTCRVIAGGQAKARRSTNWSSCNHVCVRCWARTSSDRRALRDTHRIPRIVVESTD